MGLENNLRMILFEKTLHYIARGVGMPQKETKLKRRYAEQKLEEGLLNWEWIGSYNQAEIIDEDRRRKTKGGRAVDIDR